MDELYQNLVRLSPKEQVPFRCIGCGACCKHVHMQVPVETLDAFRIVKHLQQQGEDIECIKNRTVPLFRCSNVVRAARSKILAAFFHKYSKSKYSFVSDSSRPFAAD